MPRREPTPGSGARRSDPSPSPSWTVFPSTAPKRVLDVATGTGDLLPDIRARAPRAAVIGVDRSAGMLAGAAGRGRGPLALMDARGLALPAGSIDVVVLAFLLFHLPRPVEALREARRVLRSGGAVGAVTWAGDSPPLPAERIWAEELYRAGARPASDGGKRGSSGSSAGGSPGSFRTCAGRAGPRDGGSPPCRHRSTASASS